MSSLPRILALVSVLLCLVSVRAADDEADRIAKLIAKLGSTKFAERKEATETLDALGGPALDALRKAADSHADPEVRQRAGALVKSIEERRRTARVFVTQVMKSVKLVNEQYIIEINQGELVAGLLRGMFTQLKEPLPPAIEARLKNAKDLKEEQLGDLLADVRLSLGARDEFEQGKDVHMALHALVGQLDPYCKFVDRDSLTEFLRDTGAVAGIGIEFRIDPATKMMQVVTPIKDGPAHRAGIQTDDVIEAITHFEDIGRKPLDPPRIAPTRGLPVEEALRQLLGPPGSKLRLQIRREGRKEPLEMEVVRGLASPETVLGSKRLEDDNPDFWLDRKGKIGYVRITQFSSKTSKALTNSVRQLEADGAQGLVLDLRFNPGGLLLSTIEISSLFTGGEILKIRPRSGKANTYSAEADTQRVKMPLVCLVNGESASGSEILAGCLQDHKRAAIVGQRTKGKGSVQNIFAIDEGQLILTSAYFLRPSGKKLGRRAIPGTPEDEWGVTPEKEHLLELPAKEQEELAEHLKQQTILGKRERPAFKDRQLELAVEVLRKRMEKP